MKLVIKTTTIAEVTNCKECPFVSSYEDWEFSLDGIVWFCTLGCEDECGMYSYIPLGCPIKSGVYKTKKDNIADLKVVKVSDKITGKIEE